MTYDAPAQTQIAPTSGKAIASLVLGLISLIPYTFGVLGVLAIIFGVLAGKETRTGARSGHGLGVAGLVLGIIGTIFGGFILFLVVVVNTF